MLRRTCAPLKSNDDCPSMNSSPTFEQMIHCCRSLRSCPSLSSLVPYAGAVSSKFTPSSRDRLSRLRTWVSSGSSKPLGYLTPSLRPILTVPRPRQDTSSPVLPRLRFGRDDNSRLISVVPPSARQQPWLLANVQPVLWRLHHLSAAALTAAEQIHCHPDLGSESVWLASKPVPVRIAQPRHCPGVADPLY